MSRTHASTDLRSRFWTLRRTTKSSRSGSEVAIARQARQAGEAEQVDLLQEDGVGDVTTVQRGSFVFVLAQKV
jgi:hypothetical protein